MPGRKPKSRGRNPGGFDCQQGSKRSHSPDEFETVQDKGAPPKLDLDTDVKSFFCGTVTFDEHYEAQIYNRDKYAAAMLILGEMGIEISQNARVRSLAVAWARHDHEFANSLLSNRDQFGIVEVLKAITLLDSARLVRTYEKKMKLMGKNSTRTSQAKLGKLKSDLDNLNSIKPSRGSVSGALSRHIRHWVRSFTKDELEFFALYFPTETWKKLADVCHLNPAKDFPDLKWFLSFCFGTPAPNGTIVHRCNTITAKNVDKLIQEFEIPYAYLHKLKHPLSNESLARVASYTPSLDTILWYYEDMMCDAVDAIITKRLRRGDPVTLAIGKLLERLLMLTRLRERPRAGEFGARRSAEVPFFDLLVRVAEPRLSEIRLDLPSPIVVIGDRSGSMQVAINTSVIIAGILTALTSAKLVFFNFKNKDAKSPKNITDVLNLSMKTEATGSTAPAASLWPFYSRRKIVKTFIIVTDEEENTPHNDYMFAPLFAKYHAEVYPARLVFISFLQQHATGCMIKQLTRYKPLQFILNGDKPDLTKLNTLFGLLSSEGADFVDKLEQKTTEIRDSGLAKSVDNLRVANTQADAHV